MFTWKNHMFQSISAAITCVLILGMLSMIWPAIIALIIGAFLLLNSWVVEEDFVVLPWPKVSNVLLVLASLRQLGLLTIVL